MAVAEGEAAGGMVVVVVVVAAAAEARVQHQSRGSGA